MTPFVLVIVLMVVGLVFIAMEIGAVPGFGLPGILGGLFVIGAVVVAYAYVSATYSAAALASGIGISGLMMWLLPKTRTARSMVLRTAHTGKAADQSLVRLVGRVGKVIGDLRPSGTVDFDGSPVDVVADGQYIEAGAEVRVIEVEGARVVVEPLRPPTTGQAQSAEHGDR